MIECDDALWGSIHEAGHCYIALHFGLTVEKLTLDFCRITHAPYTAPDDRNSCERLVVSAAGICATGCFLDYWEGDSGDLALSAHRLVSLGADQQTVYELMTKAHREAYALVPRFRTEILALAKRLRTHRSLSSALERRQLALERRK
jgi:hypothetical protein